MTEQELLRTALILPPRARAVLCVWAAIPGLLCAPFVFWQSLFAGLCFCAVWGLLVLALRLRACSFVAALSPRSLTVQAGIAFPVLRQIPRRAVTGVQLLRTPLLWLAGASVLLVHCPGGLLHRYEMRLCRAHLNYADLRRSPVTRALHYCPVFVTAGSCAPELPLFVWKEGTPLLQELLPGIALPPDTAPDITRRSKIYFLPAGLPLGLCLLLTAVSRTTLPTLTLPLLVPDLFFAALLAAAFVGYRREGAWMQDDHLTLRRQKGFHLHCVCALHPDLCLTVQQSPWAVAAHRANLTLIFPGRLKQKVRSVALTELAFLQQAER